MSWLDLDLFTDPTIWVQLVQKYIEKCMLIGLPPINIPFLLENKLSYGTSMTYEPVGLQYNDWVQSPPSSSVYPRYSSDYQEHIHPNYNYYFRITPSSSSSTTRTITTSTNVVAGHRYLFCFVPAIQSGSVLSDRVSRCRFRVKCGNTTVSEYNLSGTYDTIYEPDYLPGFGIGEQPVFRSNGGPKVLSFTAPNNDAFKLEFEPNCFPTIYVPTLFDRDEVTTGRLIEARTDLGRAVRDTSTAVNKTWISWLDRKPLYLCSYPYLFHCTINPVITPAPSNYRYGYNDVFPLAYAHVGTDSPVATHKLYVIVNILCALAAGISIIQRYLHSEVIAGTGAYTVISGLSAALNPWTQSTWIPPEDSTSEPLFSNTYNWPMPIRFHYEKTWEDYEPVNYLSGFSERSSSFSTPKVWGNDLSFNTFVSVSTEDRYPMRFTKYKYQWNHIIEHLRECLDSMITPVQTFWPDCSGYPYLGREYFASVTQGVGVRGVDSNIRIRP
jgi:hypothetical protein